MEQLSGMGRQIEVESGLAQGSAIAFEPFRAKKVYHFPVVFSQTVRSQFYVALAGLRRQVDDNQIELARMTLPLDNNDVFRRRIVLPCWNGLEQFTFTLANGGFWQQREDTFVERR